MVRSLVGPNHCLSRYYKAAHFEGFNEAENLDLFTTRISYDYLTSRRDQYIMARNRLSEVMASIGNVSRQTS